MRETAMNIKGRSLSDAQGTRFDSFFLPSRAKNPGWRKKWARVRARERMREGGNGAERVELDARILDALVSPGFWSALCGLEGRFCAHDLFSISLRSSHDLGLARLALWGDEDEDVFSIVSVQHGLSFRTYKALLTRDASFHNARFLELCHEDGAMRRLSQILRWRRENGPSEARRLHERPRQMAKEVRGNLDQFAQERRVERRSKGFGHR
tara:strand:+ start:160 stop:792 length:633 start_codon:yes stop_codon:yes gene_type:complete